MGEMKRITAEEAREITNQSNFLLKNAYKWIDDAAKRNMDTVYLCSSEGHEYDTNSLNKVIKVLQADGFNVENDVDNGCWVISW